MKLEGYRRLEAHVPTELWDEIEKARGQMTRSEFTRQALRAQLDYRFVQRISSFPLAGAEESNGDGDGRAAAKEGVESLDRPAAKPALPANTAREILLDRHHPDYTIPAPAKKIATTTASDALKSPAVKTAREALLERTRLMRGNNS